MSTELKIEKYRELLKDKTPFEILEFALSEWRDSITFASSLGVEDQMITHMLCSIKDEPDIFVIDTGRLHPQTYSLIDTTRARYKISLKIYYPDFKKVEQYYLKNGVNAFYKSKELRKECCFIRKVEPLARALKNKKAWITGLRKEQSRDRSNVEKIEWDELHNMYKINPLAYLKSDEMWDYIKKHNVPYNPLHDVGYPSIGCEPCTKAVNENEDPRSGRWWWEYGKKECGLHTEKLRSE